MHSIKVSHTHSFNPSQLRLLTFTKISVISIREWVETRRNRSFHYEGMNNSRILASNKNQCTPGLENLPSQNCWESLWDIQVSMLHCRISIMGIECVPLFWRLATERRNKVKATVADVGMAPSVLVVWEMTLMSIPCATWQNVRFVTSSGSVNRTSYFGILICFFLLRHLSNLQSSEKEPTMANLAKGFIALQHPRR